MIKTNLKARCANYDFKTLLEKKGYTYFTRGNYNLNIIGVRSNTNKRVTNKFDDVLVVIYRDNNDVVVHKCFDITTKPGLYYMNNPTNGKGTGILVPNQYRGCWEIGFHQGKYKALCQRKPVTVYRDNNRDSVYDLEPNHTDTGIFGVNIHKAGTNSTQVDKWSAACQVFANSSDFATFMKLCDNQIANGNGKTFTYTLLNEEDL